MSSVFRQLKVLLFILGAAIVLVSQFGGSNLYRGNVIIQPYESMEWKIFLIRGTKVNLNVNPENPTEYNAITAYILDGKNYQKFNELGPNSEEVKYGGKFPIRGDDRTWVSYVIPYESTWHVVIENRPHVTVQPLERNLLMTLFVTPLSILLYVGLIIMIAGISLHMRDYYNIQKTDEKLGSDLGLEETEVEEEFDSEPTVLEEDLTKQEEEQKEENPEESSDEDEALEDQSKEKDEEETPPEDSS